MRRTLRNAPLAKEIAVLLAVKAVLLYAIWHAFFSKPAIPAMTEGMDPSRVEAALLGPQSTPVTAPKRNGEREERR